MKRSIYTTLALAVAAIAISSCSEDNITPDVKNDAALNDAEISATSHEGTTVPYSYETLNNGTVRLTFTNTTGHTLNGDVIREGISFQENGMIIHEFSVAPGETHTFTDDRVIPGETYRYIFEYFVGDTGEVEIYFDEITPVSDVPALGNFTLIAAAYDDEYETLTDGYTIVIEGTNIRVQANEDLTRSVVFYLNGKRYRDNGAPFSLFGDDHGDYKMGRLQNGTYTLTAIAYPEKNGKGVPGDTATVSFQVENLYQQ